MRGALVAVLACGVVLTGLAPGVSTEPAFADKTKVVVEQFSGPSSDKLRQMVNKAIDKAGADTVSDKKVAAAEADLGLMQASDAYGAVAKELKASGFVRGTVSGGKKAKAKIVVRDADGNAVADQSWTGKNPAKAVEAAGKALPSAMGALLAKLKGGGGGAAVAAKPTKADKAEAAAEDKSSSDEAAAAPKKGKAKKEVAAAKDEDADDDDSGSSDSDGSVRAAASDETPSAPPRGRGWTGFDVGLGVHLYSRNFTYNNVDSNGDAFPAIGDQQEYKLPAAPAIALSGDYFFLPYLGATIGGEWTPPVLVSKDPAGKTYTTGSYMVGVGAKGKFDVGPVELLPVLTYNIHQFSVNPKNPEAGSAPRVAPVQYSILRPGVGARMSLGSLALLAGAGYLQVLNPGGIKSDYFPNATVKGIDGYVGGAFALPFMRGTEIRVTLDFRRYAFAMNSAMDDNRITGGAVDQYLGGNVGVGWRQGP